MTVPEALARMFRHSAQDAGPHGMKWCGSAGLAIFAALPKDVREELYWRLTRLHKTPESITPEFVRDQLADLGIRLEPAKDARGQLRFGEVG